MLVGLSKIPAKLFLSLYLLIPGNYISGSIAHAYVIDPGLAMRARQREMPRLGHSDRCTGKKIPA